MDNTQQQELPQYNNGNNGNNGILITTLEEEKLATIDRNDNEVQHCPRYNCAEKYSDYFIIKVLKFYLDPITKDFKHSVCCFLYNSLYFPITLGLALFDGLSIGGSVICMIAACVGLIFLWFTFEFILIFANLDLKLTYYLIQKEEELNEDRKHLIELSLYTKQLPFCCCWNNSLEHNSWYIIMIERIKYLYISLNLYIIIFYHLFCKPLLCIFTVWPIFLIICLFCYFIVPFWYAINNTWFVENKICPFGGYEKNNKNYCIFWSINSMGMAFLIGLIGLLLLPIAFRINNFTANLSKICSYYFYTYYYTNNQDIINDKKSLLSSNKHAINSVAVISPQMQQNNNNRSSLV